MPVVVYVVYVCNQGFYRDDVVWNHIEKENNKILVQINKKKTLIKNNKKKTYNNKRVENLVQITVVEKSQDIYRRGHKLLNTFFYESTIIYTVY